MVERDPSDVPPGPNPNPPALFPNQKQVLLMLATMKREIANIEKYVRRQPPEKILNSKVKKKK